MNLRARKIIRYVRKLKRNKTIFSNTIIETIALNIRTYVLRYKDSDGDTPVIAAANEFGLSIYRYYQAEQKNQTSGLFIDHEQCHKDKPAIYIDNNKTMFEQRYIIAYLLGIYLFDYTESEYQDKRLSYAKFYQTPLNNKAHKFAMALLMPKNMFIDEHNYAVEQKCHVYKYLSKLFQIDESLIKTRIDDIQKG